MGTTRQIRPDVRHLLPGFGLNVSAAGGRPSGLGDGDVGENLRLALGRLPTAKTRVILGRRDAVASLNTIRLLSAEPSPR